MDMEFAIKLFKIKAKKIRYIVSKIPEKTLYHVRPLNVYATTYNMIRKEIKEKKNVIEAMEKQEKKNARKAVDEYRRRFPDRRIPSRGAFVRTFQSLRILCESEELVQRIYLASEEIRGDDPSSSRSANFIVLQAFYSLVLTYISKDATDGISSVPNLNDGATYDFIIVGAGSAGCVLANRLSEVADYSVLLIEAGGEEPYETNVPAFVFNLFGSAIDWNYTAEPQIRACGGQRCPFARGKTLGGTSSINSLVYNRGNPLDYDAWEKQGPQQQTTALSRNH
ncbi:hypothetical protein ANN_19384 [Periplaneta americana]|uniref:Glucose-methanol-choline oxidoreductase N-terminal domain-containing protein n=1 Tax=Periplaneta americana TaxID=6978 RepID=A0ABQ8SA40_PERAM|nr:hypothetical protein ANN_19384 [Periplaneta americana]